MIPANAIQFPPKPFSTVSELINSWWSELLPSNKKSICYPSSDNREEKRQDLWKLTESSGIRRREMPILATPSIFKWNDWSGTNRFLYSEYLTLSFVEISTNFQRTDWCVRDTQNCVFHSSLRSLFSGHFGLGCSRPSPVRVSCGCPEQASGLFKSTPNAANFQLKSLTSDPFVFLIRSAYIWWALPSSAFGEDNDVWRCK